VQLLITENFIIVSNLLNEAEIDKFDKCYYSFNRRWDNKTNLVTSMVLQNVSRVTYTHITTSAAEEDHSEMEQSPRMNFTPAPPLNPMSVASFFR
jgi:hypothetical protein